MHLVNIFIEWCKNPTRNYIGSLPGRRGIGIGKNQELTLSQPPINC